MNEQVVNTGKVKIGIYAVPAKLEQDADADMVQRALLASGPRRVDWDKVILIASAIGAVFMVVMAVTGQLPGGV